jgi:hypothetical protein
MEIYIYLDGEKILWNFNFLDSFEWNAQTDLRLQQFFFNEVIREYAGCIIYV